MKNALLVTLFFIIPFQNNIIGEYRLDIGSRWDTLKIYKNGEFEYEFREGCFVEFDFEGDWQKRGDTLVLSEKRKYITFKDGTNEALEDRVEKLTHLFLIIPNGLRALTEDFYSSNEIYTKQSWSLEEE